MAKKIKVFELDFGDTNLLSENSGVIADWIKSDIDGMKDEDELQYKITVRKMTKKEMEEIPEWS